MSITRRTSPPQSVDVSKIISVRDEIIIGIADEDGTPVKGHDVSTRTPPGPTALVEIDGEAGLRRVLLYVVADQAFIAEREVD